jgi:hypothetical protein
MLSDQIDRDPSNGDYVVVDGSPVRTTSPTVPAFIRTKTPRDAWLYAPNRDFGSKIGTIVRFTGKRNGAATALENAAAQSLAPMVTLGEIQDATVTAIDANRQGVQLRLDLLDINGQEQTITLRPIGV